MVLCWLLFCSSRFYKRVRVAPLVHIILNNIHVETLYFVLIWFFSCMFFYTIPFWRTLDCKDLIFSSNFPDVTAAVLPSITKQTQWILSFKVGEEINPDMSGDIDVDGLNWNVRRLKMCDRVNNWCCFRYQADTVIPTCYELWFILLKTLY